MTLPSLKPAEPRLANAGNGKWDVVWSRAPEVDYLSSLVTTDAPAPRLIVVQNVDSANQKTLVSDLTSRLPSVTNNRSVISYQGIVLTNDVWQIIIDSFYKAHKTLPLHLGRAFIKQTRYQFNANRIIDSVLRSVASASTAAFTNNSKSTFFDVMSPLGISFSIAEEGASALVSAPEGDGDVLFQAAFIRDYDNDPTFRKFVSESIFLFRGTLQIEKMLETVLADELLVIMLQEGKLSAAGATTSKGGVPIVSAGVVSVDYATDLVEPIWHDDKGNEGAKSKAFVRLIIEERARAATRIPAEGLYVGEADLVNIANVIRQAVGDAVRIDSIKPRLSPVDADVIDGRLLLRESGDVVTNTSLDSVEAMREVYLGDANRLVSVLEGSNGAGAFLARLRNVARTLSAPFTKVSSLILGDQTRALEVMMPSVATMLTDVTAADLGAFVSGLGLLSRQFPEWRNFVAEARETLPLSEADLTALTRIAEVLEAASDDTIEPRLKAALAQTREASGDLVDQVLNFAFVRTIGNIVRAIFRYIYERAKGVGTSFNKTFDEELGRTLGTTAVGALVTLVGAPLVHLAVGLPLEFGWLVGLGLVALKAKN